MEHITCNHCKDTLIKKIGDGNTLVRCSSCEGYTHHRCVRRCPVLLKKKGKLAQLHCNLKSEYLTSTDSVF